MKLTMKLFLMISLFCSVAFADGEMGTGNKNGNNGGGLACAECVVVNETNDKNATDQEDDSIITMIEIFFKEWLG